MVRLLLPLMLVATPIAAQEVTPPKPKKPKLICRDEAETGTRMKTSTCHTQQEWLAIDQATNDDKDRMMNGLSRIAGANPGSSTGAPH